MKTVFKYFSRKDVKRGLKLPKAVDENLAEFLGILGGDGHVLRYVHHSGSIEHVIGVSGNSQKDRKYFENFLCPLIIKLFNIKTKIEKHKGQNTIGIQFRSKGLLYYLEQLGVHVGKKDNWSVPNIIMQKDNLSRAYLRGIFDTDGCISLKTYNHSYPVIKIKQKSRKAIEQLAELLKDLGFYFYVEYDVVTKDKRGFTSTGSSIYISGWKNLRKWMELIGSNNQRNLSKINLALSMGAG
jgi:intein/homing endonuclease